MADHVQSVAHTSPGAFSPSSPLHPVSSCICPCSVYLSLPGQLHQYASLVRVWGVTGASPHQGLLPREKASGPEPSLASLPPPASPQDSGPQQRA